MKRVTILALFYALFLTACYNKDVSIKNIAEPISTPPTYAVNEKGSITNPYNGSNESFQITCQIPDYGKESEIVLEFSNTYLHKSAGGWMIDSNITFISGNDTTPIHINDYITVLYYNHEGIIGFGCNLLLDGDLAGDKEFVFTKINEISIRENNFIHGYIYTNVKFEDFKGQNPKVGSIKYFDGTDYKEVFFYRYEDGKPLGIDD
ncbi:hypothetical protein [Anaerosporobacter sp.]|uniref:hypothetical protein n=1 Tax=Anaerosporobacter sp. TaxID=1872529 RepID=UPI00286F91B1|nr:hypothetical protein [Anaerosporobacter sp.]